MAERPSVSFRTEGRTVTVESGQTLLDAAFLAGVTLNSVCGGRGICQRCRLHLISGTVECEDAGRISGGAEVLACTCRVVGDVTVDIPDELRIEEEQILTGAERGAPPPPAPEGVKAELPAEAGAPDQVPLAFAVRLALPAPTLDDCVSDLSRLQRELRLQRGIRDLVVPVGLMRDLPRIVREANWDVTAVLSRANGGHELIDLRGTADDVRLFGVAVDVGTTTVVVHLFDLAGGAILGAAAALNRQASYGDDVISRIMHAEQPGGLERLRGAVVETVNVLVGGLARSHQVSRDEILGAICAGNTTMLHLLLGLPPSEIRREPYIPVAATLPSYAAGEIGLRINPRAFVYAMPGVSSYVGGDITADVLAAGMDRKDDLAMLVDVGTNGETVIGNREFLACCACSAGPAFEGGGISWGMRAARGAVQRVSVVESGMLEWKTIGGAKPRGICGSGLVDLLAELLKAGYIDRGGRMRLGAPPVREGLDGPEILVVPGAASASGKDIVLTAADIDNLLRAKAAVYAGGAILARRLGIEMSDIQRIYVAGGFGTYLDVEKAITIGLLPDAPPEKVTFIGNGSVVGAGMALLSQDAWRRAAEVAAKMTYRELSVDTAFMEEYVSAAFLPHTDCARFPRVCANLGMG